MAIILVVDDDPELVWLLRRMLQPHGDTVRAAGDGVTALERVHTTPPDLILLDWMWPGLSGWEVTRRRRGEAQSASVPIRVCSALADQGETRPALAGVADGGVAKAFSPRQSFQYADGVASGGGVGECPEPGDGDGDSTQGEWHRVYGEERTVNFLRWLVAGRAWEPAGRADQGRS